MQNIKKVNESQLQKFIDPEHSIMNFQPVIKIDRFGKKNIDRIIVLTSHQIQIFYEGVLKLEVKSMLDIKVLSYIIKSTQPDSNEMMLCFSNKNKSCVHVILQEDLQEFFDLLKLRWAFFNPNKTLKVFGVPEGSLIQYHQTQNDQKFNFNNMPSEKYRIREEEILSNEEYMKIQNKNDDEIEIENDSNNFDFKNSRDNPQEVQEENAKYKQDIQEDMTDEFMNEIRQSVLVTAVETKKNRQPALSDFKMLCVLGKGTFGKVFLSEFSQNKQLYAVKVIRKDILIEYNQIKNTQLEKEIMFKCQHQFLVGMEYLFMSELRLFFVMPFIKGGELYRFFKANRRFKEQDVKFYAVQIALALGYLHKKGIIHRDLKLENILIDMNGYLKIIDFGLAKMLDSGQKGLTKTYCGTPEYLAPEMIQQTGHNFSIDWWALGILIYEMVIGVTPFFNQNKNFLLQKIQKAQVIFPDKEKYKIPFSKDYEDIVTQLLNKDYTQRLGSRDDVWEVLSHPWFKDVDIQAIEQQKIKPNLKPDSKDGQLDFKYFNLKQQQDVNSIMPQEKVLKIQDNQHKFAGFDSQPAVTNK